MWLVSSSLCILPASVFVVWVSLLTCAPFNQFWHDTLRIAVFYVSESVLIVNTYIHTYRVSQNYPNMYFSTIISICAETTEDVDTKIFWNTHEKAKLNATHLSSPLMTPFSHYFRLALKICFSLCAQVPNRQLLTRGAFPDSTIERMTSYLLEGLQIKCETSWISVGLKFSSSWSGQRRKVASSASPEDTENHARSLTPRRL